MISFMSIGIFKKSSMNEDPAKDIVLKIQSGETHLKDQLIHDYKPFILKTVARITGRFVEVENSEEYSIGLIAFDEAINCFNGDKNKSFLNFSDLVINRRVIDYIRKNRGDRNVYPFTYFEDNDHDNFEERYLKEDYFGGLNNIEIKEEIISFKEELASFGITLKDLAMSIPKHKDSKALCIGIARLIANDPGMYQKLTKTKNIPMTDLLKVAKVYHGTIERNRKFIIAICLILNSGLEVIKSYVDHTGKGGEVRD